MKRTNYQLFDFLDFNPNLALEPNRRLWRACKPTHIEEVEGAVRVHIPFQCQKLSNDITPDGKIDRKTFYLYLKAYGNGILRLSIDFGDNAEEHSEMLVMEKGLTQVSLFIEKEEEFWRVMDKAGNIRAIFDLSEPNTDHWSDLLPPPEETLLASFYPDGEKEVRISAYDQFFPARVESMALAFIEKEQKPRKATISFHTNPEERFVGTGERFDKMDLSGRTFQLKNQDGQGVNNNRTYKNIPFYLSSEMYGIFLHTTAYSKFSLADHSTRAAQVMVDESLLDVFLIGGKDPAEILYQYRQLTGFPQIPPLWSYGIWMSRMTYFSADEVQGICNRLREENFPCDVIHLDTGWFRTDWLCEWKFNKERFPDPEGFISDLKDKGYRLSLWQMPYIAEDAEQHEEAKANDFIAPLKKSTVLGGSNFSALDYAGTIDFTYPEAVEWYKDLLRRLLKMGVVCIKTDFGEEIHLNARYKNMKPERLNNLYALLYQKAAFEVTKEETGDNIIWARAGWAGSQRYPLHWGGDAAASWDGMAGSLKGGLHLGLSGFGFWSHDVPGFHGVPNFMNSVIPDDLYVRWTQFGVFSSHIRYHGTSKREPYHYPQIADIVKKWWKLRYCLIPYILEQGEEVSRTGFPILRGLIFHHPEDRMCWHIDSEYYFGEDFLIAPVMNSENKRDVYLPAGKWVNFFSGEKIRGAQWIKDMAIPLDEMPVWIREGAVLPLYPEPVQCTDEMDLSKVERISIDKDFRGIWNTVDL